MELASSNIKKILIFPEKKPCTFHTQPLTFFPKKIYIFFPIDTVLKRFLIFSQKKAFLIFPEMEPLTFHSKLEK